MARRMITPTEHYTELAKAIGLTDLYFKREDLHPYGSHKGRSIPVMIDHYHEKGDRRFAITGSGNAALAAALHIKALNDGSNTQIGEPIELDIFVGNHIAGHKLQKLNELADDHIRIFKKERPLQALMQAVEEGSRSLRQSTDDVALLGYKALSLELAGTKDLGAIFIGTSSGTTAQALAQYFGSNVPACQIHIVQTSACHPMTDAFLTFDGQEESSVADAIVDRIAQRKDKLVTLIEKTGGHGWVASNDEIRSARSLVKKHTQLDISTNSALSVVGAMQAAYQGWEIPGAAVCIICGD
jgi:threonine dehydratase